MIKKMKYANKSQTTDILLSKKDIHGVFGLNSSGKTAFLNSFLKLKEVVKVDLDTAINRYKTKNNKRVNKEDNNLYVSVETESAVFYLSASLADESEDERAVELMMKVKGDSRGFNLLNVQTKKRMFFQHERSTKYIDMLKELVDSFVFYDKSTKYPISTEAVGFIRNCQLTMDRNFINQIAFIFNAIGEKIYIIDDFGEGMHPSLVSTLMVIMAQKEQSKFFFASNHIHLINQLAIEQVIMCEKIAGETFAFNPTKEYIELNINDFVF
jgi:hypothetical protein